MSEREYDLAEKLAKLLPLLQWALGGLVFGAFAIGGWVAAIQIEQTATRKEVEKIRGFEVWRATTDLNSYTNKEAAILSNTINTALATHDKRLQRVEDAQISTARALERIEDKLGTN